ncbi:MAG: hypothetical protein R3B52_00130 [Candidatus Paceibacterota bacterium]
MSVTSSLSIPADSIGADEIAPDSVALTTDTTGNYLATLTQGTGLIVTGGTGEGATPTVAINTAEQTFGSSTIGTLLVTSSANFTGSATLGNLSNYLAQNLYHEGDTNTFMIFSTDQIGFTAGGELALSMIEGASDYILFGEAYNIGIASTTPTYKLSVKEMPQSPLPPLALS